MGKTAYLIRDDYYHPKEIIDPAMEAVLDESRWNIVRTDRVRDLFDAEEPIDLVLLFTNGRPAGETDLTYEEQDRIVAMVEEGMGVMFVHAGLVLIEADSPFYLKLGSGRFIEHSPDHVQVTTIPIRNVSHPILEGIDAFTVSDEHYYCQVDTSRTDMLMMSTSKYVTTAGAWAHTVGAGRVAGLIPGHTKEALTNQQMVKLLINATEWCRRQSVRGQ